MTGATERLQTVDALHAVAEHVLAAALHAATGRIGLAVTPDGFGTPAWAAEDLGGRQLVVRRQGLVEIGTAGDERVHPLTSIGELAEAIGVVPGAPASVYTPVTALDLDAPLAVDPDVVDAVVGWFGLGQEAMSRFAGSHPGDGPSTITLWPEHFDLGLTAAEVNYGISPGDADIPDSYAYVGPWTPVADPFFDRPFGAARTADLVPSPADLVAFFEQGRSKAGVAGT